MAETAPIDFTSDSASPLLSVKRRVARDGLVVSRCGIPINPGAPIMTAQFALFMHESEPLDLICRQPGSLRARTYRVTAGQFYLSPAGRTARVGWTADKQSLVIAMENGFIERTLGDAFGGYVPEMRSRGGLGASRRRRVADFIKAHLEEDIGLAALAAEAGLSRHHFGKAFKATSGKPPHRYITERRVQKAREMLLSDRASITDIALALGFSSHSHFTDVFHKTTGTTPSLFRGNRA